ncbi:MAG: TIGR04372 family glycosyltransferase [Rhodospirillales bacterium]|nr:TIGR04372 family glycosyltransferase [Rhodospirillales bacterium]MBO6787735.1 TIGR04372 family glycosyltransferase [Rhodospirillales bacterium]
MAMTFMRAIVRAAGWLTVLPMLYLIEPFYRIRIGTMYTQRIGHLAENAETFIRKMRMEGFPPRTGYFFFGHNPANRQLYKMWLRTRTYPVRFIDSRLGTWLAFTLRPALSKTRFWEACKETGVEYRAFDDTPPVLYFTDEEEERGRRELEKMGIGRDDWFVAFHARDNAFLSAWRPELKDHWARPVNQGRNVDVRTMLKAADYIASKGGFAIRVGAQVEEPLPPGLHPKIIDYASSFRNEFMDIYIAARSRFFISSLSGIDSIALAFNVPLVTTNHSPYNFARYNRRTVMLPRLLKDPETGQQIPFWSAQSRGYFVGWERVSSNHETWGMFNQVPSSEDDILDAVKDMIDQFEGRPPISEAKEIQDAYGEMYLSHKPDHTRAGRISARFALKYRDLIVP